MERELRREVQPDSYFKSETKVQGVYKGHLEMRPPKPYIISGGKNTEHYYFKHINESTKIKYEFNVKPEYFGDESSYIETFPRKIKQILKDNTHAKIFCVLDWDDVFENKTKLDKHKKFEETFKQEISDGRVTMCQSMPCFEYWIYLHFEKDTTLRRRYSDISKVLATTNIKKCFPNCEGINLKKMLKRAKHLKDRSWVENLCIFEGNLEEAIKQAENNIIEAQKTGKLEQQSYSYVYNIFK